MKIVQLASSSDQGSEFFYVSYNTGNLVIS